MNGNEIQIENGGFTRIHNAILEKLATTDLNGSEFRCLMFLFRKTYGFKKTEDKISFEQWAEGTGLARRSCIRTIQCLIEKKIITASGVSVGRSHVNTYGFNKYIEEWDQLNSDEIDTISPNISDEKDTINPLNSDEIDTNNEINSDQIDTRNSDQNCQNVAINSDQIDTHKRKYIKENKETTTAPSVVVVTAGDVFELWKNNMPGSLTEIIVDELNDFIDTYGATEVDTAIRIAVKQGKRNTRYIHGVLKKRADGSDHKPLESPPQQVETGVFNLNFASI